MERKIPAGTAVMNGLDTVVLFKRQETDQVGEETQMLNF